jgi:chromosome segregation ATPase
MNDIRKNIDEMIATLKQERDELRVKLNLAKMEAGDEWEKLEGKMHKLESKAKELGHVTAEASRDIGEAAKLLGEEIRDGFKKISKHF